MMGLLCLLNFVLSRRLGQAIFREYVARMAEFRVVPRFRLPSLDMMM